MVTSNHTKVLKQIGHKPGKKAKYEKHNTPRKRSNGQTLHKCQMCGRTGAHNKVYGLRICRQCFRDNALNLGFKKYS